MKLCIAGDSAGQPLIAAIAAHLDTLDGVDFDDLSPAAADAGEFYANTAERACRAILDGAYVRGVLCCGTGIGVCISANKVPGIRAALTHDTYSAERAALSNNAQVITLGARVVGPELAKAIVSAWLGCEFDEHGRSAGNVAAMDALDERYSPASAS